MHLSDTSSISLILVKLVGSENYSIWSRRMLVTGLAKNKLGFIDGTCRKENFHPSLHHLWYRCTTFVFTWIMNVVSKDPSSKIIYSTSAFLVWNELMEQFDKINDSKIYQLHREINITQKGLDSIQVYFGKLKLLWDEFAAVSYLPNCGYEKYNFHVDHQNIIKFS